MIIGGRLRGIVGRRLVAHTMMVVMAVIGGVRVMIGMVVAVLRRSRVGGRLLHGHAMPPGRPARGEGQRQQPDQG